MNLKRIGQAAHSRGEDTRLTGEGRAAGGLADWPDLLLGYLDADQEMLLCPADQTAGLGREIEAQAAVGPKANGERQAHHFVNLTTSPLCRKLSQEQYDRAKSRGWRRYFDTDYQGYEPGRNPNTFWVCLLNVGAGEEPDFGSLRVKVVREPGRQVTLLAKSKTTERALWLVSRGDDKALRRADKREEAGRDGFVLSDTACSYGINAAVWPYPSWGTGRILALDYDRKVARATDSWRAEDDGDGGPGFARHAGQINVLSCDGSVRLMWPEDIDPAGGSVRGRYWDP